MQTDAQPACNVFCKKKKKLEPTSILESTKNQTPSILLAARATNTIAQINGMFSAVLLSKVQRKSYER